MYITTICPLVAEQAITHNPAYEEGRSYTRSMLFLLLSITVLRFEMRKKIELETNPSYALIQVN